LVITRRKIDSLDFIALFGVKAEIAMRSKRRNISLFSTQPKQRNSLTDFWLWVLLVSYQGILLVVVFKMFFLLL